MSADIEQEKMVARYWASIQVAADRALEGARYRQPDEEREAAEHLLEELDLLEGETL